MFPMLRLQLQKFHLQEKFNFAFFMLTQERSPCAEILWEALMKMVWNKIILTKNQPKILFNRKLVKFNHKGQRS